MGAEDMAVTFVIGLFAMIPIMVIGKAISDHSYQEAAKRLIPESWKPDYVFRSYPMIVVNSSTREIAFIDREKATIVNFSDIKSWQHFWTNNTRTNPGIFVNTIKTTQTDHRMKIVASGMASPAITVKSVQSAEICDVFELYLS